MRTAGRPISKENRQKAGERGYVVSHPTSVERHGAAVANTNSAGGHLGDVVTDYAVREHNVAALGVDPTAKVGQTSCQMQAIEFNIAVDDIQMLIFI